MAISNPVPGGTWTDGYGPRGVVPGVGDMGFHTGQDIAAPAGTPIYAAHDGVVTRIWWDQFVNGTPAGGWMVEVRGDDGFTSRYAHMQDRSPLRVGQRVLGGSTVVGRVGRSGSANGYHLHFELLRNGQFIDPAPHLKGGGGSSQIKKGKQMFIRIQSTNRGIALIGPGYYRHLVSDEEVIQSEPLVAVHLTGNDRQFDLWRSMALQGQAAK